MSQSISRAMVLGGILALAGSPRPVLAQSACCAAPVRVQPCFQTVAMTEIRECRQTVQRPVVETKYVDQQVTEYRQVTENKTAQVPTVCYQNVTECQTITKDCGRWETRYHCRPIASACEYDDRPDLLGALNRASYSVRMAFTPKSYAERVYVPNVITQAIPVTRQVAVHGSQTVNYQVSRLVPYTTTRKVAVNTVRMVAEEIVTQQPVTVMRTVPVGLAYGYGTIIDAPTTTAVMPSLAPLSTATLPKSASTAAGEKSGKVPPATNYDGETLDTSDAGALQPVPSKKIPASKISRPSRSAVDDGNDQAPTDNDRSAGRASRDSRVASAPSAVTAGRWVARKTKRPIGVEAMPPETLISATKRSTVGR